MLSLRLRIGIVLVIPGVLIGGWIVPVWGQASTAPYSYQLTPYLFATGLDGTFGARDRTTELDANFADILNHLDFVTTVYFDAQWGRWRLLVDTFYTNVSGNKGTPGPLFSNVDVDSKMFFFDPEVGYQIFKGEGKDLDVTGGVRYWHLKNNLDFFRNGTERFTFEQTKGWTDPIVGLRFAADLSPKVYVTAKGDIGGFSAAARLDWQAFGSVGYKFTDRVAGVLGYRYLSVDYKSGGFVFDNAMRGLILGASFRF